MSRAKVPTAGTLDDRLEAQRRRLFDATAVVNLAQEVARHGDPIEGKLSQGIRCDLWCALRLAGRELDAIAGNLDPAVMLHVEPSQPERVQELTERLQTHLQGGQS